MTIDKIDELFLNGDLDLLVKSNIIPAHIYTWREIYHAYNCELLSTQSKMQAMENVAFNYNVSVDLVRHIRRKLG